MSNLSPRALALSQAHGPGPVDWERVARIVEGMRAEDAATIADLKVSVIAIGAPWAVQYADMWRLPRKHLFPEHYDMLEQAGARMDDFVRWTG